MVLLDSVEFDDCLDDPVSQLAPQKRLFMRPSVSFDSWRTCGFSREQICFVTDSDATFLPVLLHCAVLTLFNIV